MAERTRRGNKALKTAGSFDAALPREGGGGDAGNAKRARAPKGAPIAVEGKALKGEAQGRSGTYRAGRPGGGRREGGSQTPDMARVGGGIRRRQRVRPAESVS